MKKEMVKDLFRKSSTKMGAVALAALVAVGSLWAVDSRNTVPELVTFVDTEGSIAIEEEEVPLATPKVTKSTKTKKTTKKIKLKKASKKTYKQSSKPTTKKATKTSKTPSATTTTVTVTDTNVLNQYKKGSNINTQVTTTKTTVTKTVVSNQTTANQTESVAQTSTLGAGTYSVATLAPKVDSRVANAYNTLGFTISVKTGVNYSGLFDARSRSITLKKADTTVYHELGHFVAFIAGNYDLSAEFQGIYNREKSKYTAFNKAYVLSSPSEYFAESFKNYTLEPAALKASRPETYNAMQNALSKITSSQVSNIANVYKAVWG